MRSLARRHLGKIVVTSAVAPTAAGITTPGVSAATTCVHRTFARSNTYQPCVRDLQVLMDDLRYISVLGPNQLLATDGYYGPRTASDVAAFNHHYWGRTLAGTTTHLTWRGLCRLALLFEFHGAYWHRAGCPPLT